MHLKKSFNANLIFDANFQKAFNYRKENKNLFANYSLIVYLCFIKN